MITELLVATSIALAPAPTDVPNQADYLESARAFGLTGTDDALTQLAMRACVSLHPNGPNHHLTGTPGDEALENQVAAILITRYHLPPMTATAYVALVEADLCP